MNLIDEVLLLAGKKYCEKKMNEALKIANKDYRDEIQARIRKDFNTECRRKHARALEKSKKSYAEYKYYQDQYIQFLEVLR